MLIFLTCSAVQSTRWLIALCCVTSEFVNCKLKTIVKLVILSILRNYI